MGYENLIYQEIEQEIKEQNKSRNDSWLLGILAVVLMPLLCIFLVGKPHEYVSDIDNLPEPIQTSTSGGIIKAINGEIVYIDFLAEYEIKGRVLAKKSYADAFGPSYNRIVNKMGPRDFVLGWGVFSKKENMDLMRRNEYADRFVQPRLKEYTTEYFDWFDSEFSGNYRKGNFGTLGINFSNNHPIWSTQKIRILLKKIKVGDVIKLKGYLVYVHPKNGGWYRGPSSLTREDEGDGACEIIYVTDVTWLKEK